VHFDLAAAATAFGLIFLAELPDKTMFASLAMGTRMRPPFVWIGATAAFVVHVAIAVGAGSLLALLPNTAVKLVSAVLFAFGAFVLLRGGDGDEENGPDGAGNARSQAFWPVFGTAFMAVFIGEWGDLTQITTANLAARHDPLSVAVGSALALSSVSALALIVGRFLAKRAPLHVVQRVGGVCMAVLAVWSVVEIF
jgi:putative Ca2+/H+ antiporter (TMEM165/GDT1 family)